MKNLKQLFSKLILIGLLTCLGQDDVKAQVITRILSPDDKIENYMPWYNPNNLFPVVRTPLVDAEAILKADQATGREMPRIGVRQESQFTALDGGIIESGNYTLWSMEIKNDDAKSLRFKISLQNIPDDFILFYYNQEYNFLVGPIKSKNFKDNNYVSDYIPGNQAKIILFSPQELSIQRNDIRIEDIYVGLESTYAFDSAFGTSEPCNINVACNEGLGWDCQISSVCKIITGDGACSGSLINNDCCDLTPYILTADHCLKDPFGNLRNFGNYSYRFNYQSPQCSPNGETTPSQWIVFSGSQLRSNWITSDFGLLELFEEGIQGISYAGWNRAANPPTNEVTCIHHPSGDVKKIAVNSDGIGTQGSFWLIDQFDAGLVEPGSSGSPLFDENQLIIGDLHGGDNNVGCVNGHGLVDNNTFGQLSVSWTGGGTTNSRLQDWLGASTNPNTIGCMEHPLITGSDFLCASLQAQTYTLINNMPCTKDVQWEISPNSLASPSSGTGNSATLSANNNAKGSATMTFTLTSNECDPVLIEKEIWVGTPEANLFYNGENLCVGETTQIFAFPITGGGQIVSWWTTGALDLVLVNNSTAYVKGMYHGLGTVFLKIRNECGETTESLHINVRPCEGGPFIDITQKSIIPNSGGTNQEIDKIDKRIVVFPNPLDNNLNVVCDKVDFDTEVNITVTSLEGKILNTFSAKGSFHKIDLTELPTGIYILSCEIEGKTYHQKISKI